MKVVIAGGRKYHMIASDVKWLNELNKEIDITEIVSGKATGADYWGEQWAKYNNIPIKEFPAKWKNGLGGVDYSAGHKRNEEMAKYADAVVLFPGGTGTANMRKNAIKYGLPIYERSRNTQ